MTDDSPKLADVLARLRAFRRAFPQPLSFSDLATRVGLSRAALQGMDKDEWSPSSPTIRALEGLVPDGWRPGAPLSVAQIANQSV